MKFIAAILVIFSHSFRISWNTINPLDTFTGGQISFGGVAVALFLFASGFYVSKGLFRRKKECFILRIVLREFILLLWL